MGLPTADLTLAAGIQLLLNPKLPRCKFLLQRGQGGAVYVCNVYGEGARKVAWCLSLGWLSSS